VMLQPPLTTSGGNSRSADRMMAEQTHKGTKSWVCMKCILASVHASKFGGAGINGSARIRDPHEEKEI
jgi:hypothetical protein